PRILKEVVVGPRMLYAVCSRFLAVRLLLAGFLISLLVPIAEAQNADFSIIVLPDTQYYSESYPAILNSQMQWIVKNAAALNVQMVLAVGDIVINGSSETE